MGKSVKGTTVVFWITATVVVLLNVVAWHSTVFCDWYIAHIFPIWVNTYGRLTGLFPFSVGELLIFAGLALVATALFLFLPWSIVEMTAAVRHTARKRKEKGKSVRQTGGFRRFARRFYRFFAWTLLVVSLIMTLNCFILYHASTFAERYLNREDVAGAMETEDSLRELIKVYNMVAENCLILSKEIKRDENGRAVYECSIGADGEMLDMADNARQLMGRLGETYAQLDGYYPRPKPLFFSDFMCQQYMCGYYFPFSMEANYNDVMFALNIPATMCHELAHLRGFIYEDEANFIAYLACMQSDDAFFRYAGCLSVLPYLYNDLYEAQRTAPETYARVVEATRPVALTKQVWEDAVFVTDEEWERINKKAWIDTETVDKAADVFINTNLKANGISDGDVSYSRVVDLMLAYYRMTADQPVREQKQARQCGFMYGPDFSLR